jgi:hypothetical protein
MSRCLCRGSYRSESCNTGVVALILVGTTPAGDVRIPLLRYVSAALRRPLCRFSCLRCRELCNGHRAPGRWRLDGDRWTAHGTNDDASEERDHAVIATRQSRKRYFESRVSVGSRRGGRNQPKTSRSLKWRSF